MNLDRITAAIDAEIAKRSTNKFGITMGVDLFRELIYAGKIKKIDLNTVGLTDWSIEGPAYDGRFFVSPDPDLANDQFVVGVER